MPVTYNSPGVYREEIFLQPEAALPTGIPGFVGMVGTPDGNHPTPLNTPVALHRREELAGHFNDAQGSFLADVVRGFFDNGGRRCYVVGISGPADAGGIMAGIDALSPLDDLDLLALPDAMTLTNERGVDVDAITRVQQYALAHCAASGTRFAILDTLPGSEAAGTIAQRHRLLLGQPEPVNAALYYPWLRLLSGRLVPPCGHVAGIYARTDARVGVFKAPANEELLGVLDLEFDIDEAAQAELNPEGVNCVRAFRGRGIRLWGARTLNRDSSWRYVNVRRLFLTFARWVEANMNWANFETNVPTLWVRIRRELSAYLTSLWQSGALQGATIAEAFYVKCDEETNPPETRETGQVVTEIGLAPVVPAEFIRVRITHRAGTTEIA